ncbi:AB hydrolase superfamily protein YfhM [Aplysia californica]|uniref:AB hydrolase superfamily protein YfhM n=1 Tax=Aplysia californica TaxID=6500 RepID=A0ABM0JQT2_APLCA|nr:AB hydrolase superfamily protein YfhM [Aplysia californica]
MAALQRVGLFCMATYYGFHVTFRLIKLMFTIGPKAVLGKKEHPKPKVLSDPALGSHGILHLDEVRIHCVSSGPEDKPLMLFLHGFPEFWYSWRHQIREFQKDYRVVAIDQRGYGDSDKPSGIDSYVISKLTSDVSQVIASLGYKSCVLVAHDWGGAVAWAFARRFPDMVDKLIVMNSPPSPVMQKLFQESKEQRKMSWYMFLFQLPWLPELFIRSCDYAFLDRVFGNPVPAPTDMISPPFPTEVSKSDVEAYKHVFSQPGTTNATINWYRAALQRGRYSYTMDYTMPVLLIWGLKDIALSHTVPDIAQAMNPKIAVKRVPEAGHFVQMEAPEVVNSTMRDWLSKQE